MKRKLVLHLLGTAALALAMGLGVGCGPTTGPSGTVPGPTASEAGGKPAPGGRTQAEKVPSSDR